MKETTSIRRPVFGLFYLSVLGMSLLIPSFVLAAGSVIRSGETVAVEANQVLEGDFYAFGKTITISGAAERDVYVAGGSVTVNAPVAEDLVIVGGSAQVHADIADDVRIIGGEVVIANPVKGDVVILGGTVRILSTATIGGDLIFFGGDVRVDGRVEGTVYGTAERVRIDSFVGGDVTVRAGESFTLGDAAEVTGNISYTSRNEFVRAQGAVVNGSITRETLVTKAKMSDVQGIVLNALILIFSSLTVFFIARSRVERLAHDALRMYGRSGLIGLGMLLAIPIVAIILTASLIGAVVGVGIIFMYMFFMAITYMLLPIFIGTFFERLFRKDRRISLFTVILGVGITMVLPYIPFLGAFALLLMATVVFGSLCLEIYRVFRSV